jgi:hypothetical protein
VRGYLVDQVRSMLVHIILNGSWEGGTVTAVDVECWKVLLFGF